MIFGDEDTAREAKTIGQEPNVCQHDDFRVRLQF